VPAPTIVKQEADIKPTAMAPKPGDPKLGKPKAAHACRKREMEADAGPSELVAAIGAKHAAMPLNLVIRPSRKMRAACAKKLVPAIKSFPVYISFCFKIGFN
jgi:hypothetical protein